MQQASVIQRYKGVCSDATMSRKRAEKKMPEAQDNFSDRCALLAVYLNSCDSYQIEEAL